MLDNPPKEIAQSLMFEAKPKTWNVAASTTANRCKNFIRHIVDNLNLTPNPEKSVIALSIGDPTVYGNLKTSDEAEEAVMEAVKEGACNGYGPCVGFEPARRAVADYLSFDGVAYDFTDVILCSGCSSSIEMCVTVLADPYKKHNILIPRPGFPLYRTLAETIGVEVRYYNLIPERKWEIDLDHLEAQINEGTAAIVVNNPSNPCGSVYGEAHLRDILEIAYRRRIPIIADEIYERLVFPETRYISMASINPGVPLLVCGGLAKRFLVPGWRVGWIAIHDPAKCFDAEIRNGLNSLSQRTIGCNTIVQGALPTILEKTPKMFYSDVIDILKANAEIAFEGLKHVKGLTPYMPEGTMYMMVEVNLKRFPDFATVLEFSQKMMEEESVFCLPGEAFFIPGFVRLVITVPGDLLKEACVRMAEFCNKYYT